jgi:sugar phosphate isomerase/epimerase
MDRRAFVRQAGAGILGVAAFNRTSTMAPLGIQLYTVRRELEKDFDGTLEKIAAIGYREAETASYFDHSPERVRAALARAKLTSPSAHIGGTDALGKDLDRTLDRAARVGHRWAVCASVDGKQPTTVDEAKRIAELFNRAGAAAKKAGLKFAFHNHEAEFGSVGPTLRYDVYLENTDPSLVEFEMDLYWITKGRQDPLAYFAKWPGRFPLVHVKDMDATPARGMADVGKGIIDFKAIFAKRQQAGVQHYYVEHDEPTPDGIASAQQSFAYLSKLTI